MSDKAHSGAQHIQDSDFETAVLKNDKPVLVDFYADWCGPCKMAAPILDQLSAEQSDVKIMKMNVDENQQTPAKFGVMSIPTVILFKNGEEIDRIIGFRGRAGYDEMIEVAKK